MVGRGFVVFAIHIVSLLNPVIIDSLLLNRDFISLRETFQVILSIQQYFKSGCLHFVWTDDFHCKGHIIMAKKFFSSKHIFSTSSNVPIFTHADGNAHGPCSRVIYILSSVQDVADLLSKLTVAHGMSETRSVGFLHLSSMSQNLEDHFMKVNIPYNFELLLAQRHHKDISILEIYRVASHLPLRTVKFGSWSPQAGFKGPNISYMFRRRPDLQGILLRTTNLKFGALTVISETDNGIQIGGFNGNMWKLLEHHMNFVSKHYMPVDGYWGSQEENGSWNGLVGSILRNEADVGFSGITMTLERANYVKFITPHLESFAHIFIQKPSRDTSVKYLFMPLKLPLWLALFASVVVLALVKQLCHRFEDYPDCGHSSLQEHLFHTFGAIFCKQTLNSNSIPRVGGRMVIFLVYLIGITAVSSYSAFVMSSLIMDRPKMPFTSLAGYRKDGTFSLGMVRLTSYYTAFKEAKVGILKELYDKAVAPHPEMSPRTAEEGVERVCKEKHCFILTDEILQSIAKNCNMISLPEHFQKILVSCAFSTSNPYVDVFNLNILKLKTSGIAHKLHRDATILPKLSANGNVPQAITFQTVIPVTKMWVVGVLFSLLFLALELLVFNLARLVEL